MHSLVLTILATPLPISVERMPDVPPDGWLIGGTIASAVVALFTGYLALQTKRLADRTSILSEETQKMARATVELAKETRETIAVAQSDAVTVERHHQQSLSPAVVLRGPRVSYDGHNPELGHMFTLRADQVVNIGFGPALKISYEVRLTGTPISNSVISPMGSLDRQVPLGPEIIQMTFTGEVRASPPTGVVPAEVLITYFNVFDQYRVTKYLLKPGPQNAIISEETILPQQILALPI